jgi:hypothetical protein
VVGFLPARGPDGSSFSAADILSTRKFVAAVIDHVVT